MSVHPNDRRLMLRAPAAPVSRLRAGGFGSIYDDYSADEYEEEDVSDDYSADEYPSPVDSSFDEGFIDIVTHDLNDGDGGAKDVPIGPYDDGLYVSSDDGSMADYGEGGFILTPEVFGDGPQPSSTYVIGDVIDQNDPNDVSTLNAQQYAAGRAQGRADGAAGKPYHTTAAQHPSYKEGYAKGYPEGQAAKKTGGGGTVVKTGGGGGGPPPAEDDEASGMSTGTKLLLGALAVAAVGGAVVVARKRRRAA